ncbi:MAG: molybdenum cofactor biosynthesis protein MoaE [Lentisphaerota bacterium]
MLLISSSPLENGPWAEGLTGPDSGALVTFHGCVRSQHQGHRVLRIEYEIYEELCQSEFKKIMSDARRQFAIHQLKCVHRSGPVAAGEVAVWIGVSSAHRRDAFRCCEFILEQIKKQLPIWKKEIYEDGHAAWIDYGMPLI